MSIDDNFLNEQPTQTTTVYYAETLLDFREGI